MDKFDFDVAADTAGFRLSKRELITGAGAAAALALMPRISRAASETWDLIVVGGGSAGLPCAIFAAQQGARVLVVDRAHRLGGTLDRSFGQIAAAGTRFQAEQEIEDSPEAHFDDIMRISKGKIDQDLVRVFVNEAARTIDWLGANGFTPLPGHPVVGGGHEPYLTRRYQWAEQFGVAILKVMLPQFLELARQGSIEFLNPHGRTGTDSGRFRRGERRDGARCNGTQDGPAGPQGGADHRRLRGESRNVP
ncbi:MAG: FAD-dependent oxidoreductase [Gammaproteobacteria bacterium]|nr:FAD-dependent oxidoreductase [Gammaproteobacteria bacterium]